MALPLVLWLKELLTPVLFRRYYHDITTCTPEGETMYYANGTVVESKLRVLSRTYPQVTAGALKSFKFDTASVVYADGMFVLLSLLPLHVRERKWYRRLLFWYYAVVNAVLVVAVNMADCVYFRYTQKRFTADEIFFADNGNSLQLVGKFMAENWYLVIAAAALTALLVWGYGRKIREESLLSRGWGYYAGGTAIFVVAAGLCIAGMRGGSAEECHETAADIGTAAVEDGDAGASSRDGR